MPTWLGDQLLAGPEFCFCPELSSEHGAKTPRHPTCTQGNRAALPSTDPAMQPNHPQLPPTRGDSRPRHTTPAERSGLLPPSVRQTLTTSCPVMLKGMTGPVRKPAAHLLEIVCYDIKETRLSRKSICFLPATQYTACAASQPLHCSPSPRRKQEPCLYACLSPRASPARASESDHRAAEGLETPRQGSPGAERPFVTVT